MVVLLLALCVAVAHAVPTALLDQAVRDNRAGRWEDSARAAREGLAALQGSPANHALARNLHAVLAMSLKGADRPLEALEHFRAADRKDSQWLAALAETHAAAGNSSAALLHLTEAMVGGARRDRHWKLLVEVLGSLGLWDHAEAVLRRCTWDGCSFGCENSTTWVRHTESEPLRALLLRSAALGRHDPALQQRARAWAAGWTLVDSEPATLVKRLGLHHKLKQLQSIDLWYELYWHAEYFVHPVPAALIERARQDHRAMAALLQGHVEEAGGRTQIDSWDDTVWVKLPWGVEAKYRPYEQLRFPIYNVTDGLVYAKLLANSAHSMFTRLSPVKPFTHVAPRHMPDTLRVGLFTADLRPHAMLPLLVGFLKHRPRTNYSLHVFHAGSSAQWAHLLEAQDGHTNVTGVTQEDKLAALVHAQQLHVLVDATGHCPGGRIAAFAYYRPAPVQVSWAGYPQSLGSPHFQYAVADVYSVPPEARPGWSESIIHLPGSWLINDLPSELGPLPPRPSSHARGGGGGGGATFCNFGQLWKFDDVTLRHWCAIVDSVPGSRLLLVSKIEWGSQSGVFLRTPNTTETLLHFWTQQCGLDVSRLEIVPRLSRHQYVRTVRARCDVMLDTPNYNAGVTALEWLYAAVPVVHMAGPGLKLMNRAAGSALRAAGLYGELVASDWAAYRRTAVALATDAAVQARVAAALDAVPRSPLFQPRHDVAALFAGLREAYRLWWQGRPPAHIFTHPLAMRVNVSIQDYDSWFGEAQPGWRLGTMQDGCVGPVGE